MGALGGMLGLNIDQSNIPAAYQMNYQPTEGFTGGQRAAGYAGTQQALTQQQQLLQALQAQGGIANQQQIYGQLQDVIAGRGPNPAQAQLAAATGQNVAQQAALMAGQRGAGANVGLMARQAAGIGSQAQQQAAGQAAQLQAQQSLGALGAAGALAQAQAGQQMQATGALTQAQLTQQQMQQEELARRNAINAEMEKARAQQQFEQQQLAAGMASQEAKNRQGLVGGILSGAAGLGMAALTGGASLAPQMLGTLTGGGGGTSDTGKPSQFPMMTPGYADGGQVQPRAPQMSAVGRYMSGLGAEVAAPVAPMMAKGGDVGAALKSGGHVPGQASVAGDSLKNDTVHALLSPGEVVIPRSVMQSSDPARGAAAFVQAILAKKGMRS